MKNFISIIITTKNEEKNISNILNSINNQTFKNYEVIVVDNNSTDKTKELAEELGAKVFNKGPERSAQRNFGVSESKGNYVLILDADMILEKEVLEELHAAILKDSELKTLTIKEEPMGDSFWAGCKKLELEFYSSNPNSKTHAARCFDRKVFEEFKGYDLNLTGPEDWDLPERINKKYPKKYFTKSKIYHNEGDYGLWRILNKKFYYAQKASTYITKHKMKLTDSKFVYFLRPEFYEYSNLWTKNLLISAGLILMLTLETFAGGLGFIYGKIKQKS
jgi:glycosyltransferase involved in cell wall biosynthesis